MKSTLAIGRRRSDHLVGRVLAGSTALALLAGCAAYHAMPLVDQRSASTLVDHRELEGLHIAVRDLSGARISEKHFGCDLAEEGYLPVLVLLELDSESRSAYTLRQDDVHLVLQNGTRLRPASPAEVADDVGFSHWRSFFGYLFLLPGPFVSNSVSNANRELEEDYTAKALQSVRLSRNMPAYRGVVYFALDETETAGSLEDAFVELTVYREADHNSAESLGGRLDFAVHFSQ